MTATRKRIKNKSAATVPADETSELVLTRLLTCFENDLFLDYLYCWSSHKDERLSFEARGVIAALCLFNKSHHSLIDKYRYVGVFKDEKKE